MLGLNNVNIFCTSSLIFFLNAESPT